MIIFLYRKSIKNSLKNYLTDLEGLYLKFHNSLDPFQEDKFYPQNIREKETHDIWSLHSLPDPLQLLLLKTLNLKFPLENLKILL